MDGLKTRYPVELEFGEDIDDIESLLSAVEKDIESTETRITQLLNHIDTIKWLREIGVSGEFRITY